MASPRVLKLADQIKVIMAEMLERRIKDPRLGFITITDVRLTGDSREATVFYTVLGTDQDRRAPRPPPWRRRPGCSGPPGGQAAGAEVHPDLIAFVLDAVPENARQIDELLAQARPPMSGGRAGGHAAYAGRRDPYKHPDDDDERCLTAGVRPGHLRQAGRLDLTPGGGARPAAAGDPQGGPRRHARPDGHRGLDHRREKATRTARPALDRQGVRGDDPAGHVHRDRRRRGRGRDSATGADTVDADIEAAMAKLAGEILQVPSAVSAIKVDGVRSYARVRGPRRSRCRPGRCRWSASLRWRRERARSMAVPVVDLDVEVECSTGTYVRALARDLGAALGVGGHLTALRRTRVGSFGSMRPRPSMKRRRVLKLPADHVVRRCFSTPQRQ